MKRRAALGFDWTSFFLIRSWAWLLSAETAGERSLPKQESEQAKGQGRGNYGAHGSFSLVQDGMCQLNVLVHRLLNELLVLLFLGLGDYVPYKLFDAGVDVLLVVARHCRIFAKLIEDREATQSRGTTAGRKGTMSLEGLRRSVMYVLWEVGCVLTRVVRADCSQHMRSTGSHCRVLTVCCAVPLCASYCQVSVSTRMRIRDGCSLPQTRIVTLNYCYSYMPNQLQISSTAYSANRDKA